MFGALLPLCFDFDKTACFNVKTILCVFTMLCIGKMTFWKSPIFFPVTGDWAYVSYMRLYGLDQINSVIHHVILLILWNYGLILILFVTIFLHRVPMWWMNKLFLKHSCLNQVSCVLLLISLEYQIWCCNFHFTTFLGGNNSFLSFVACDSSICFESNGVDGRYRVDNDCDLLSERLFCSTFCCWSKRQHPKLKDADVKPFYFSASKC